MSFVTYNEELHQLDRTVGVLFVGYVVTMSLYGFNAYQVYIYFSTLQGEHYIKKSSVALLAALDAASVGLLTEAVHFYMVSEFPTSSPAVKLPRKTFAADNGLAALMIFIIHICYAQRIRRYHVAVAAFVEVVSTAAFALGIIMSVKMAGLEDFDLMAKEPMKSITGSCQGLTFVASLTASYMLFSSHEPRKNAFATDSSTMPYDYLIEIVWERGLASTIVQLSYFIIFMASPSERFWMPFEVTARRVFMLSLVTLYIDHGISQGRETSDDTVTYPVSKKSVSRGRRNTSTGFSSLGGQTGSSDTVAAARENVFHIHVSKTVEQDIPFGDFKKSETQDL